MKLSTLFARERPAVAPPPVRADLFLLRSGTGAWLAVEGGEVVMAAATTPDSALYLCIPKSGPQASFLIARDGRRLGVEGDGLAGPAISGRGCAACPAAGWNCGTRWPACGIWG